MRMVDNDSPSPVRRDRGSLYRMLRALRGGGWSKPRHSIRPAGTELAHFDVTADQHQGVMSNAYWVDVVGDKVNLIPLPLQSTRPEDALNPGTLFLSPGGLSRSSPMAKPYAGTRQQINKRWCACVHPF